MLSVPLVHVPQPPTIALFLTTSLIVFLGTVDEAVPFQPVALLLGPVHVSGVQKVFYACGLLVKKTFFNQIMAYPVGALCAMLCEPE